MGANVEPEEVEAILDLFGPRAKKREPGEVEQRDFQQPRRLSPERAGELSRALHRRLPELDRALAAIFGRRQRLELAGVHEINAEGLFDEPVRPMAMGQLEVAGQPAWVVWQNPAAVAAVETILGSRPTGEARDLSELERKVLKRILGAVADFVASAVGAQAGEVTVVADPDELASWRDAASGEGGPDAHRTCVDLTFHGPEDASTFHVYVPGVRPDPAGASQAGGKASGAEPPAHLAPVALELAAELGVSHVALAELLALEVGDVIPLETEVDEPLVLRVEGVACATARLGTRDGRLAVRIQGAHPPEDED